MGPVPRPLLSSYPGCGMWQWLIDLFKPVVRVNTTDQTSYLQAQPTIYDTDTVYYPKITALPTITSVLNTRVYTDYLPASQTSIRVITHITTTESTTDAGYAWYEITDGVNVVRGHPVGSTAGMYTQSGLYTALSAQPIVVGIGERIRFVYYGGVNGKAVTFTVRYYEVLK